MTKTVFLLLMITFSEATIGVFVKLTDGLIPVPTLNFYALSCATLLLMAVMPRVTEQPLRFPRENVKDTVAIGLLIAAQTGGFNFAMTLVPIANAVIFWSVAPFFTFLFSWFFLGEPAKKIYMAIFAIAMIGIVIAKPLQGGYMAGNLVALGVGVVYAAMVTYMRHEGKTETGSDIAWSMLVAALVFSPSMLIFGPGELTQMISYKPLGFSLPVILWPVALGIISIGLAYLGIAVVLKTLNANVYSLVDIIVSPVVASTFGYLIFSEMPGQQMIYGGMMLLGSGFWLTREMSKSRGSHPQYY